ncbi:MAG TPA: cupredoxin domain-containing protein [Nitrospiria bacterium]|jgi:heme/copper-type cytochrome/quinol oxidase subunit 2|nr:cupredoxin domain-containing protein [Nitrospiria bacterium]
MELKRSYFYLGLLLLTVLTALTSFAAEPLVVQTSSDEIQRAEIIADSYSYTPDHLIFKSNVPVELIIHSKTWLVPHNFMLKDADAGLDIKQDIPAGKSVVVKFTPTRSGKFKFYCDKKLLFFKSHEDRGMKGILEVTE